MKKVGEILLDGNNNGGSVDLFTLYEMCNNLDKYLENVPKVIQFDTVDDRCWQEAKSHSWNVHKCLVRIVVAETGKLSPYLRAGRERG